jgi:hypothetical protein
MQTSMLTLKAIFKDGKIFFLDEAPFIGEFSVRVTFQYKGYHIVGQISRGVNA